MASKDSKPPRLRQKDQKPPSTGQDERSTLLGFLDYLRDAIAAKLEGAPEPEARTAGVPSGTTLLGLVKHVTAVERFLFLGEDAKSWPKTFQPSAEDTLDGVLAGYREAVRQANERILACTDLTLPAADSPTRGSSPSMRWALIHMIEETGRHAGHADILREQIDGATGR
ncbi:DinB family protein [Blastococcus xanthinilyticus]|uniref:Uncharacterized protein DUF664 n=1 Tax=Blastococcus xanthinilyticus TaxID=1564164 RepID=A0A5S5D3A8_9ACTN|nr:DinB family protein [Blastococcus xanthinilyticus]TYP90513.1 uncharacterized protein DUF664 [Blastococcus xanthinilyticus]